jgi:hypothetical protein
MKIISSFFFFIVLFFIAIAFIGTSTTTSSPSPISLKWRWVNERVNRLNISYGDPVLFPHVGRRNSVALVYSTPNNVYLKVIDPETGDVELGKLILDTPFPTLSGWVAVAPGGSQSFTVCPETTCFYIGTMKGVMAVGGDTGKVLWKTDIFDEEQQVPGHATFSTWQQNGEGVIWLTFENGVAGSQVFLVSPRDGFYRTVDFLLNHSASEEEIGYTLIWPIESATSNIDPLFASAGVYGAYRPATKQVGIVCRAIVKEGRTTFPPKMVTLWSNWTLSYSPPGLWDNPNLDVDLVDEAKASGIKQAIFAYLEPNVKHRIVNRLTTPEGRFVWSESTFADVPDYDTYAYLGNFFRLMVRQNNTLQLEKMNGVDGTKMWEYQRGDFSDTSSILLVGSGIVCSFGLSSGLISIVNEKTGAFIGEIDVSKFNFGGGLTTGVTTRIENDSATLLMFGDVAGNLYGYRIVL